MRIAIVAPLGESVPPHGYGGSQRVISYLTEGLVKKNHDVTLFAVGSSQTKAKLQSVYPRPLSEGNISRDNVMYTLLKYTQVFEQESQFDVINIHIDLAPEYIALPQGLALKKKVIFTPHFTYPTNKGESYYDRHLVLQKFKDCNFTSISNAQRKGGENLNWLATIYNGIDTTLYSLHTNPKDYFLWVGKFNPDKGVEDAILASKKAGVKLVIAGKIDPLNKEDYAYYVNTIKPLIDGKQVQYIGEVTDAKKNDLYGNALGFLNPIKWNEPFGLVMAEALASGCPVISYPNGAAPEIITDSKHGYLVNGIDGIVDGIKKIQHIDRATCRKRVEEAFSVEKMVNGYESVYHKMYQQNS